MGRAGKNAAVNDDYYCEAERSYVHVEDGRNCQKCLRGACVNCAAECYFCGDAYCPDCSPTNGAYFRGAYICGKCLADPDKNVLTIFE
jgi:hypothetical protein